MAASNQYQRDLAVNFASKLVERGYEAGQDTIGGGCGQLHFVQKWFTDNADKAKPSVGNGKPMVHVPAMPKNKS